MAITLASLPAELLLQICKSLPSAHDVSNFRLVCCRFGDIGLPALGTTVTFFLMPESIARLCQISSHHFFRHHISRVVCLMGVFRPYERFMDFKDAMKMRIWDDHVDLHQKPFSNDEWADSVMHYNALLVAQDEAFKALEPLQDIEVACRRFSNLHYLEINSSTSLPKHSHRNYAYQSLHRRHGQLTGCFGLPSYDFYFFSPKIALPGVHLLESMLGATGDAQVRGLVVDSLALDAFDARHSGGIYSRMRKLGCHLRSLNLHISFLTDEEDRRAKAEQTLSENRIKGFLSSAPHLENVNLYFDAACDSYDSYYTSIAHILPIKRTWSHLRRLWLSGVEMQVSVILEFLSTHADTLEDLGLENCAISPRLDQPTRTRRCRWSDILIPLTTTCSLKNLSLIGKFRLCRPDGPDQNHNQGESLPYINMSRDRVEGVNLTVGKAIGTIACSRTFDSFLHGEVGGLKDLVAGIKQGIVKDLMDHEHRRQTEEDNVDIPTGYVQYLKAFATSTYDNEPRSPEYTGIGTGAWTE